jgi:hypothetical protein
MGCEIPPIRHGASTAQRLLLRIVVVTLAIGAFSMVVRTIVSVSSPRDTSYPDSATVLRVQEFVHSGRLYPDPYQPPYYFTLYGPLTYVALGAAQMVGNAIGVSSLTAIRAGVLVSLSACLLLVFLISLRLHGSHLIGSLSLLFAASALPLSMWSTQVRGDFTALAFSLAGAYLFVRELDSHDQPAGLTLLFAATALLVKQTFVALPISIFIWLFRRRAYKRAIVWSTGALLLVGGGYLFTLWREPLMWRHVEALRSAIVDYRGAIRLLRATLQPTVPCAVVGVWLVFRGGRSGSKSLVFFLLFCGVAWLVALSTIPQVGANANYFWEPLFASAVFAGYGLWRLPHESPRTQILVSGIVVIFLGRSALYSLRDLTFSYQSMTEYQQRTTEWNSFAASISGHRLLSDLPDVAVLSVIPEVPDPFFNSMLERRGVWSYDPIVKNIELGRYEFIVVGRGDLERPPHYRGIQWWRKDVWKAIGNTYHLVCTTSDMEIWTPKCPTYVTSTLSNVNCLAGTVSAERAPDRLLCK